MLRTAVISLLLCVAAGCHRAETHASPAAAAPDPAAAPPIRVHPDVKGAVYRYFPAGERAPKTATAIDKVPQGSRDLVLVVPADVDTPAGLVYVADLRTPAGDGSYPYKVVATADLDRTLDETRKSKALSTTPAAPAARAAPTAPTAPSATPTATTGEGDVVLFSASWCGKCKQAARFMNNKGIRFVEKDIEKDPGAQEEMMQKADAAGFPRGQLTGVPVIWIKGHIIMGFDPGAIERYARG